MPDQIFAIEIMHVEKGRLVVACVLIKFRRLMTKILDSVWLAWGPKSGFLLPLIS